MKKLLGLAAFILAFSPFAQAQSDAGQFGHPDARNDRSMQSAERDMHEHRAPKHMHHMKHHRPVHHKM